MTKTFVNKNKLYSYFIQVNCEWSEWQKGKCDKACGGGNRTISRHIKIQAKHGGQACVGSNTTTESCNVKECPGKKMTFYQIDINDEVSL